MPDPLERRFRVVPGRLRAGAGGVRFASGYGSARRDAVLGRRASLAVLEAFLHATAAPEALALASGVGKPPPRELRRRLTREGVLFDLARDTVALQVGKLVHMSVGARGRQGRDLTLLSREDPRVLLALFDEAPLEGSGDPPLPRPELVAAMSELRDLGILAEEAGTLDWGDLRRAEPLCPRFGWSRGTPIDRHYLARFLAAVRGQVVGETVEIGGQRGNPARYELGEVTSYRAVDLASGPDVDVSGDVHDPALLPAASVQSLVAFYVLEHCREPWTACANLHRWLRPGGALFLAVPAVQRLHDLPGDYWRFTPDGLRSLLGAFEEVAIEAWGNPTTVVAQTLGIAAEELEPGELERHHADYPVSLFAVARK